MQTSSAVTKQIKEKDEEERNSVSLDGTSVF
jgi:hypothetical protein